MKYVHRGCSKLQRQLVPNSIKKKSTFLCTYNVFLRRQENIKSMFNNYFVVYLETQKAIKSF